jgi:excisionase family DNA binding protein
MHKHVLVHFRYVTIRYACQRCGKEGFMREMLLTTHEAARRLAIGLRTITDRRWRARVGLGAVKVGRLVRFRAEDIDVLIRRGKERLPR